MRWLLCVFLVLTANLSFARPPEWLLGYWEGALIQNNGVQLISLEVREDDSGLLAIRANELFDPQRVQILEASGQVAFTAGGMRISLKRDEVTGDLVGRAGDAASPIRVQLRKTLKPAEPAVKTEEVKVRSGDIDLAGSLIKPDKPGRHPAILIVPGRGGTVRNGIRMAQLFASHGFAVLSLDQRGHGGSGGNAEAATVRQKIADGVAAIRYLARRKDVDAKRIGIHATSAGAWIAPFVATEPNTPVAFLMTSVGPAESVRAQQLSSYELYLRNSPSKLTDAEVAEGMDFVNKMLKVVETGEGKAELQAGFEKAKAARYGQEVEANQAALDDNLSWLPRHYIDPKPALEKLRIPMLAVYGEADWIVEPQRNLALLRQYVRSDLTTVVIPRAGHGLMVRGTPRTLDDITYHSFPRLAPGVAETFINWAKKQARL